MRESSYLPRGLSALVKPSYLFLCYFVSHSLSACELSLRVVASSHWPPFFYKEDGQIKGIEVDILTTVMNKTPFCFEFVELPSLSRATEELKKKRVDLLVSASFTQPRTKFALFSKSYRSERIVIFRSKKANDIIKIDNYRSIIDNKNVSIAVHAGSSYGKTFETFLTTFKGRKVQTTSSAQRFQLLKKQRVNYALEDELAGLALLETADFKEHIVNTSYSVFENNVHYMIRFDLMTETQLDIFHQAIEDSRVEIEQILSNFIKSH